MTEIEAVYQKIHAEIRSKSAKEYIEFYEAHKVVIEGGDTSLGSTDYINIVSMTADYALALSAYGSAVKSILYLDKAIRLIENAAMGDLSKDNTYEILLWTRGYEYHNQKNYLEAVKDFTYLAEHYPDNDKYRNWLSNSHEEFHWRRANENYKLKNYKEASKDFRYLVENFPDNDQYKKWLRSALTVRAAWISYYAWFGLAFCVILHEFVTMEGAGPNTRLTISMFGLGFSIVVIFVTIRNYLIKSKIK